MLSKLFFLFIGLVNARNRFRCRSGWTTYTSIFDEKEALSRGFRGEFEMKICNDNSYAQYAMDISGDFEDETSLKFHLHSNYNNNALNGDLGSTGTSGHYDPTFKCGQASSNLEDSTRCFGDYNCADNVLECELGDLSGKLGNVEISHNRVRVRNLKDINPPINDDFSLFGSNAGSVFSSIVFHRGSNGERLFGGRIIKECSSSRFRSNLDGSGINNDVRGFFEMKICNDGSFSIYEISLNSILNENNLKYHLHSAFIDNNELGSQGTGGHYDPLFKCGSASSYSDSVLCEDNYPNNGYELGDLSGKLGVIPVNNGIVNIRLVDNDPPRINDYDESGLTNFGSSFSSIVFHKVSGERLFGARIKQCSCTWKWYSGYWDDEC